MELERPADLKEKCWARQIKCRDFLTVSTFNLGEKAKRRRRRGTRTRKKTRRRKNWSRETLSVLYPQSGRSVEYPSARKTRRGLAWLPPLFFLYAPKDRLQREEDDYYLGQTARGYCFDWTENILGGFFGTHTFLWRNWHPRCSTAFRTYFNEFHKLMTYK